MQENKTILGHVPTNKSSVTHTKKATDLNLNSSVNKGLVSDQFHTKSKEKFYSDLELKKTNKSSTNRVNSQTSASTLIEKMPLSQAFAKYINRFGARFGGHFPSNVTKNSLLLTNTLLKKNKEIVRASNKTKKILRPLPLGRGIFKLSRKLILAARSLKGNNNLHPLMANTQANKSLTAGWLKLLNGPMTNKVQDSLNLKSLNSLALHPSSGINNLTNAKAITNLGEISTSLPLGRGNRLGKKANSKYTLLREERRTKEKEMVSRSYPLRGERLISNVNSVNKISYRRRRRLRNRINKQKWAKLWKNKISLSIKREEYRIDNNDKMLLNILKERKLNLINKFSSNMHKRAGSDLFKNQVIKYQFSQPYAPKDYYPSTLLAVKQLVGSWSQKDLSQLLLLKNNKPLALSLKTTGTLTSMPRSLKDRSLSPISANTSSGGSELLLTPVENKLINTFGSMNKLQSENVSLTSSALKGSKVKVVSNITNNLDLDSFYKLLQSFFKGLRSFISLPIIEPLSDKLNIRLFYLMRSKKYTNIRLRFYKRYVKNSGKLFKEIKLRALFSNKIGKQNLGLFLANWKIFLSSEGAVNNKDILTMPSRVPFGVTGLSLTPSVPLDHLGLGLLDDSNSSPYGRSVDKINISKDRPQTRFNSSITSSEYQANFNSQLNIKGNKITMPRTDFLTNQNTQTRMQPALNTLLTLPTDYMGTVNGYKDIKNIDYSSLVQAESSNSLAKDPIIQFKLPKVIPNSITLSTGGYLAKLVNLVALESSTALMEGRDLPAPKGTHKGEEVLLTQTLYNQNHSPVISSNDTSTSTGYTQISDTKQLLIDDVEKLEDELVYINNNINEIYRTVLKEKIIKQYLRGLILNYLGHNNTNNIKATNAPLAYNGYNVQNQKDASKVNPVLIRNLEVNTDQVITNSIFPFGYHSNAASLSSGSGCESHLISIRDIVNRDILTRYCMGHTYQSSSSGSVEISNIRVSRPLARPNVSSLGSMVSLKIEKLTIFVNYLEKLFNKAIELDLTRLKYPYHESQILSQVIGKTSKSKFAKFFRMMKTLRFTARVTRMDDFSSDTIKKRLPSLLSGIKVKLAGRLLRGGIVPRYTEKRFQSGSLSRAQVGFLNTSRVTLKNKRGAYSFTVTISHLFDNLNSKNLHKETGQNYLKNNIAQTLAHSGLGQPKKELSNIDHLKFNLNSLRTITKKDRQRTY